LSISERRLDPQKAILVEQEKIKPSNLSSDVSTINSLSSPIGAFTATPRPSGNPSLFERSVIFLQIFKGSLYKIKSNKNVEELFRKMT